MKTGLETACYWRSSKNRDMYCMCMSRSEEIQQTSRGCFDFERTLCQINQLFDVLCVPPYSRHAFVSPDQPTLLNLKRRSLTAPNLCNPIPSPRLNNQPSRHPMNTLARANRVTSSGLRALQIYLINWSDVDLFFPIILSIITTALLSSFVSTGVGSKAERIWTRAKGRRTSRWPPLPIRGRLPFVWGRNPPAAARGPLQERCTGQELYIFQNWWLLNILVRFGVLFDEN